MSLTVSQQALLPRMPRRARHPAAVVLDARWLALRANVTAATLSLGRPAMPRAWGERMLSGCRKTLTFTLTRAPLMPGLLLRV